MGAQVSVVCSLSSLARGAACGVRRADSAPFSSICLQKSPYTTRNKIKARAGHQVGHGPVRDLRKFVCVECRARVCGGGPEFARSPLARYTLRRASYPLPSSQHTQKNSARCVPEASKGSLEDLLAAAAVTAARPLIITNTPSNTQKNKQCFPGSKLFAESMYCRMCTNNAAAMVSWWTSGGSRGVAARRATKRHSHTPPLPCASLLK